MDMGGLGPTRRGGLVRGRGPVIFLSPDAPRKDRLEGLMQLGAGDDGEFVLAGSPSGWLAMAVVGEQRGQLVVTELHVLAPFGVPTGGLTTDALRAVRPATAITRFAEMERQQRDLVPIFDDEATRRLKRRRKGARVPADYYAEVALAYLDALRQGPRAPIQWMVQEYARQKYYPSERQVRDDVDRARDYGWLTRPGKGRAGGEATEKLKAWREGRP